MDKFQFNNAMCLKRSSDMRTVVFIQNATVTLSSYFTKIIYKNVAAKYSVYHWRIQM